MAALSFLIPNLNGRHLLETCYRSILGQKAISAKAVLIDNASSDDSLVWTRQHYPAVQIIEGRSDWGFAHAINAGIQATDSEWVVFFNNDAWLAQNFGEQFLKGLSQFPKTRAFACCGISGRDESRFYSLGDIIHEGIPSRIGYMRQSEKIDMANLPDEVMSPSGYAAVYHRSLFKSFGLLCEAFHSFYEDCDFGMRLFRSGSRCRLLKDAVVYHLGGATGHAAISGSRLACDAAWRSARNSIWFCRRHFEVGGASRVTRNCFLRQLREQIPCALRRSPIAWARLRGLWAGYTTPPPSSYLAKIETEPGWENDAERLWRMWSAYLGGGQGTETTKERANANHQLRYF